MVKKSFYCHLIIPGRLSSFNVHLKVKYLMWFLISPFRKRRGRKTLNFVFIKVSVYQWLYFH